jgi:hypothetical protein
MRIKETGVQPARIIREPIPSSRGWVDTGSYLAGIVRAEERFCRVPWFWSMEERGWATMLQR